MKILPSLALITVAALLSGGCCSYERGGRRSSKYDHPHSAHHGAVTPLPPPGPAYPPAPPTYQPAPTTYQPAPVVVAPTSPTQSTNIVVGDGDTKLELKRETFAVRKQVESAGEARIKKWITKESVSIPTTVCRDDIVVERLDAAGPTNAPWFEGEAYISLPLTKEVVVGVVTPSVYQVLKIKRITICTTNAVTGEVRTEHADVIR